MLVHFGAHVIWKMARYEKVNVRGYEEFCQAVSQRSGKEIFAYFSGDKDAQGNSWCPDCVKGNAIQTRDMHVYTIICTFSLVKPIVAYYGCKCIGLGCV